MYRDLSPDLIARMLDLHTRTVGRPIAVGLVDKLARDTRQPVAVSQADGVWTVRIGEASASSRWAFGAALLALVAWIIADGALPGVNARTAQLEAALGLVVAAS